MLLFWVSCYIGIMLMCGVWAARRVKNSGDFFIAGSSLSVPYVLAALFISWFGATSVLGGPGRFLIGGLTSIIEDPFSTTLCLVLLALGVGRLMYRWPVMSIGDIYRQRYGVHVEKLASVIIVLSYVGWLLSQVTALSLIFLILSNGSLTYAGAVITSVVLLLLYTSIGGMWSIVLTDFFQAFTVIAGLFYIAYHISCQGISFGHVVSLIHAEGALNLLPAANAKSIFVYIAAWLTMSLGLLPQQDVFQRVRSARNERTFVIAASIAAPLYLAFSFVPLYLVYAAKIVSPHIVAKWLPVDPQMILPLFIQANLPVYLQVVFFGSVLAGVLSCGSTALFAPAVIVTENLISPLCPTMKDHQRILASRIVLLGLAVLTAVLAIWGHYAIYDILVSSYRVTLVAPCVPLCAALFWRTGTSEGAWWSMIIGLFSWFLMLWLAPNWTVPPHLIGFLASLMTMIVVSYSTQKKL